MYFNMKIILNESKVFDKKISSSRLVKVEKWEFIYYK